MAVVEAMVRGYYQYKEIWHAQVGEELECQRETGNAHDIFVFHVYLRTTRPRAVARSNYIIRGNCFVGKNFVVRLSTTKKVTPRTIQYLSIAKVRL